MRTAHYRRRITPHANRPRAYIYPKHNILTWVLTIYSWWRTQYIPIHIICIYADSNDGGRGSLIDIDYGALCSVYNIFIVYISYAFLPRRARPTQHCSRLKIANCIFIVFTAILNSTHTNTPLLAHTHTHTHTHTFGVRRYCCRSSKTRPGKLENIARRTV